MAICGRDRDRLDEAIATMEGAVGLVADVSDPDGARHFIADATDALGGIDILVPNAGGPPAGGFADTPFDAYEPALALNLLSTVAMCQAAVPAMQERGWGRVVAITSSTVRQPNPMLMLSNVARAGATGFLKTLSAEIAKDGVTVNSVQPGLHATDRMVELHGSRKGAEAAAAKRGIGVPGIGRADDFGRVVAFLCSESARYITGAALPVDGGEVRALQ